MLVCEGKKKREEEKEVKGRLKCVQLRGKKKGGKIEDRCMKRT